MSPNTKCLAKPGIIPTEQCSTGVLTNGQENILFLTLTLILEALQSLSWSEDLVLEPCGTVEDDREAAGVEESENSQQIQTLVNRRRQSLIQSRIEVSGCEYKISKYGQK